MSKPIRVFIPEWVPLDNKGEEAIIFGMVDGLFPGADVQATVLEQNIEHPYERDGLRVWPHKWFYAPWRNRPFSLSIAPGDLFNSSMSLLRHSLELTPWWVRRPPRPVSVCADTIRRIDKGGVLRETELSQALRELLDMDYVIVGHDGVLSHNEECHVINLLADVGFDLGVLGTCLPIPLRTPFVRRLYANAFARAKYFFTRNPGGVQWAAAHLPGLEVESAPDPAFAMRSAPSDAVDAIIRREGLEGFFQKPVVMMTVVENDVTLLFAFREQRTAQAKARRHLRFIAEMVAYLVETLDAHVLFLPHCIGPSRRGDDRRVARDAMAQIPQSADRVRILETEYDARALKGLIGRADLLIAERIHSLIGAVGVHTPFLCLGSRGDDRATGIVEEFCDCRDLVYYMDNPDMPSLFAQLADVWARREEVRDRLKDLDARFQARLAEVRRQILGRVAPGRRPRPGRNA